MQADGTPALMRLAVVERQLIMQGLDISSLARLASTCRQMRGEALHREAGKFISEPHWPIPLYESRSIDRPHPAHASPLFCKHAPMSLRLDVRTLADFESLMDAAATFSRVCSFAVSGALPWWTDDRMIRVLSMPSMQEVRRVNLEQSSNWLNSPRVQTALWSLPQLQECVISVDPIPKLLPSATTASHVSSVRLEIWSDYAASVRALRALRLAPALTNLRIDFGDIELGEPAEPVLAELVCCLPPTVEALILRNVELVRDLPRPLVKALFSRTPLLRSLELKGSIKTCLLGLLDAGLRALPKLHQVRFRDVTPTDFSFDQDPDPIPPLLRRFLHRFPQVTVQWNIDGESWEDPDQLSAVQVRYLVWPRVELYWAVSEQRIAMPPSPHASDDEEGSDVEEWADPLAAED